VTELAAVHQRALRRARRTWYRYPLVYTGATAATGLLIGNPTHLAVVMAGASFAVSLLVAVGRLRASDDVMARNLYLRWGVPRRQRRTVRRDIWRGTPSRDRVLRAVEAADAAMIARVHGWLGVAGALASPFVLMSLTAATSWSERLFDLAFGTFLAGAAVWCLVWWSRAHRFVRPYADLACPLPFRRPAS